MVEPPPPDSAAHEIVPVIAEPRARQGVHGPRALYSARVCAPIRSSAFAKLNLALAVGPPIDGDPGSGPSAVPGAGLHPIASIMVAVDLSDDIAVRRRPVDAESVYDIRWEDGSPVGWPVESDLAVRAHRELEAHAGPLPLELTIRKRIPAGSGLGGGSSDAAATIRAVDHLFTLGLAEPTTHAIAAAIGSDVAFFLDHESSYDQPPRPALVEGVGDRITRLGSGCLPSETRFLVVCPPFGCSTPEVYRAFDAAGPRPFRDGTVRSLLEAQTLDTSRLFNDLALPAGRVRPELAGLRDRLARTLGLPVHVSGSGSTLFACVTSENSGHAIEAAGRESPDSAIHILRPAR